MHKQPNTTRRGFTLIELLVVIAIIGILAGILFPVFARVRESGRKVSCASNLKQIGIAHRMYLQDYDSILMPLVQAPTTAPRALLEPYDKSRQLWVCPSDTDPGVRKMTDDAEIVSYQFNSRLATTPAQAASGGNPAVALDLQMLSQIKSPSLVVLTHDSDPGEGGWTEGNTWDNGKTTDWPHKRATCINSGGGADPSPCGTESYLLPFHSRHNGSLNVLYLDGHVKSQNPLSLTDANFYPSQTN